MTLTRGAIRENHVVEFEEGRRIAWTPAEPGQAPPGHLWRWELEPAGTSRTRVTHTYDWTRLTDENRLPGLGDHGGLPPAAFDRLAAVAEGTLIDRRWRFRYAMGPPEGAGEGGGGGGGEGGGGAGGGGGGRGGGGGGGEGRGGEGEGKGG